MGRKHVKPAHDDIEQAVSWRFIAKITGVASQHRGINAGRKRLQYGVACRIDGVEFRQRDTACLRNITHGEIAPACRRRQFQSGVEDHIGNIRLAGHSPSRFQPSRE